MTHRSALKYIELQRQAQLCTDRYVAHEILRKASAIQGETEFLNRITKLYNS